jgi:SAM-dependent methyltransferase
VTVALDAHAASFRPQRQRVNKALTRAWFRLHERGMVRAMDVDGPNAEQITYWNDTAGPKWVAYEELLDTQIRPLGERAMDRVGVEAGVRVLDIGCGTGQTSIELARRVGARGAVTAVDISAPMLARARTRAEVAGARNVDFVHADAQTHRFAPESVDVCFSRFGVMFFAAPDVAFTNLRATLRPGGRLGFVCWQQLPDNPWMAIPLMAAAAHITLPPPPAPDAPGPFAFADQDRVRGILEGAGFGDVAFEDHRTTLTVGGDGSLDRAVDFLLQGVGPTSAAMRQADPAQRATVSAAVRDALRPYHTPQGLRMASATWLVTARRR